MSQEPKRSDKKFNNLREVLSCLHILSNPPPSPNIYSLKELSTHPYNNSISSIAKSIKYSKWKYLFKMIPVWLQSIKYLLRTSTLMKGLKPNPWTLVKGLTKAKRKPLLQKWEKHSYKQEFSIKLRKFTFPIIRESALCVNPAQAIFIRNRLKK